MTFYFYDLETSGINARSQRIMQFAGQRTDQNLDPIGEPQNWLIKLTDEILPDPEAVLLTGITPQKTLEEGYTEAEFLKLFDKEVCQPDTIITGFNNIRFDDEFMRNTLWRNFYDAYKWQWQDGRSRWDLLDVVRMVRALRPDGIKWPVDKDGHETNRLELITKINRLDHDAAHDALSDVMATIGVARLIKEKQPKMYDYLLSLRDKKAVQKLVNLQDPQPFVYTSGRYSNKWHKTAAVVAIGGAEHGAVLAYDLRQDPSELSKLSDDELAGVAFRRDKETELLVIKTLKPNTCPALAPLGVLDEATQQRLELNLQNIKDNLHKLVQSKDLINRLIKLHEDHQKKWKKEFAKNIDPELQLYDGFISEIDQKKYTSLHSSEVKDPTNMKLDFVDERLQSLWPRYLARNFTHSISSEQREVWDKYRAQRLLNGLAGQLSLESYALRLSELAKVHQDEHSQYLIKELQLWAESVAPIDDY